jgi:outer membrane protein assembly factor BamB
VKRLSKVMKARQNEAGESSGRSIEEEVETVSDVDNVVFVDVKTGQHYSYNAATGQTQWLDVEEGGEEDGTTIEEQGESKQNNRQRRSFRKLVSDQNEVYYIDVETGEDVWILPEDGELVEEETSSNALEMMAIRNKIVSSLVKQGNTNEEVDQTELHEHFGIDVSSIRGEWIEVHDERSGLVAYFNKTTEEIQPNRPRGWVTMLSMVFGPKEITDIHGSGGKQHKSRRGGTTGSGT